MSKEWRYSFSTLKNITTCPAKLYYKQLAREGKIKEDYSLPLVFGSADHEGFEKSLLTGEDPKQFSDKYLEENLYVKMKKGEFAENDFSNPKVIEAIEKRKTNSETCLRHFKRDFLHQIRKSTEDIDSKVEVKLEVPFRKGIFVGKADLLHDTGGIDWKTGKFPDEEKQRLDAQGAMYVWAKRMLKIDIPDVFRYVFLIGKPTRKIQEIDDDGNPAVYKKDCKSGKKGDPKLTWDTENKLKYSINIEHTDETINRAFNEKINPLAEVLESGVIWKNESDFNCSSCPYRTACLKKQIPLPHRADYQVLGELDEVNDDE